MSDGMDQLCSLLHLPWPLRVGLGLIKTMEASTCPLDHSQSDRLSCRYFGSLQPILPYTPSPPLASWGNTSSPGLTERQCLQIEDTEHYFQAKLKAGGILDITERYTWDGARSKHKRRDKRSGPQEGLVELTDEGPSVLYVPVEPRQTDRVVSA